MRSLPVFFLLFATTSVHAQEGMIRYAGTQTVKMDLDALMANMPGGMDLDSSMVEMIAAQMPEEGVTISMGWDVWFSEKTVLTKMVLPDFMQGMVDAVDTPGITPFTGGASGVSSNMSQTTYYDYENGSSVQAFPSFMAEPYVVTSELQPMDWSVTDQDSSILGYSVQRATVGVDTLTAQAWFTPELASPAGPMTFGGLPGVILHLTAEFESRGASMRLEFSADSISTELDTPVIPPAGTPITRENYQAIIEQRFKMMRQQMQQ